MHAASYPHHLHSLSALAFMSYHTEGGGCFHPVETNCPESFEHDPLKFSDAADVHTAKHAPREKHEIMVDVM
jgi:hypothetical protein